MTKKQLPATGLITTSEAAEIAGVSIRTIQQPLSTVLGRLALADLCEASHALQAGAVADWCATLCRAHRRLDAYASALRSEGQPVPPPGLIVTEAATLTPDERAYFSRYGLEC